MSEGALERWVSNVLRTGTAAAAVVIAAGVLLRRADITWVGLLTLTLTPAIQVAAAAGVLGGRGERRYAMVALAALAVLLVALWVARGARALKVDIVILIASLGVILLGAELFTNGIEWFGHRLNLAEGAVGSVLAAVATAMPETLIPVIAIIGPALAGHAPGNVGRDRRGCDSRRAVHARHARDVRDRRRSPALQPQPWPVDRDAGQRLDPRA